MLARPRFYFPLILVSTSVCTAFYAYDFIVVGFKFKIPTKGIDLTSDFSNSMHDF